MIPCGKKKPDSQIEYGFITGDLPSTNKIIVFDQSEKNCIRLTKFLVQNPNGFKDG